MQIKVCGMRDKENISGLMALKPDYIGFIFYDKSKRFVADFPQIEIPSSIKKVGVFVNENIEKIIEKANKHTLDFVQLHGDETADYCSKLRHLERSRMADSKMPNFEIIKAFSVDENFDFTAILPFEKHVSLFLFDTKGKNYGGNGIKFNWDLLQNYTGKKPFLLSGGISKNDAEEIKKIKHPAFLGIDINSGFEWESGLKNIIEIKEFKNRLL